MGSLLAPMSRPQNYGENGRITVIHGITELRNLRGNHSRSRSSYIFGVTTKPNDDKAERLLLMQQEVQPRRNTLSQDPIRSIDGNIRQHNITSHR